MPISKEQWGEIEGQLSYGMGRVEMNCDGHNIVATIETLGPLKQGIAVYIDGIIKGGWLRGEDEAVRKFHREQKRYVYPAKDRERAKAMLKKRGMPEPLREIWQRQVTHTLSFWYPWWTNAKAFRRHISKTCKEIDVVKIGY